MVWHLNELIITIFTNYTVGEDAALRGVYAFFSQINIPDSVSATGRLVTLGSQILGNTSGFSHTVIPVYISQLSLTVFGLLLSLAAYGAFSAFIAQGGVVIGSEPGSVMKNGIIAYLITIALVLLLSLTIVLLPIGLLFIIAGFTLVIAGQASMAMLIGLAVSKQLKRRFTPFTCVLIGTGTLAVILSVPYLNFGLSYVFLPILCMGITITSAINGLIKKKFYYAPFKSVETKKSFDKKAIRGILLNPVSDKNK